MNRFIISAIVVILCHATGLAYTADDPSKTVISDGTITDIASAITYVKGKAEDGWTVIMGTAGGSYTWTTAELGELTADVAYNFTLRGASPSNRPTILVNSPLVVSYATGKLITVKDAIFTAGSLNLSFLIRGSGPTPGFRFTNIKWVGDWTGVTMQVGDSSLQGSTSEEGPWGLIDNCEGDGQVRFNPYANGRSVDVPLYKAWRRPMDWGTVKAVVFEDNYFHKTTYSPGVGLLDIYNAGSIVFRRNIVENSVVLNHGADHFGDHVQSALKHEIYDNTFRLTQAAGYADWFIYLRGGTAVVYNNTFAATGVGSAINRAIYWDNYRSRPDGGMQSNYDRFYGDMSTTIASGSNGQSLSSTAVTTVNVASTAGLAPAYEPTYSDLPGPLYTTIAASSNGAALPQGTINVVSTAGFPDSGIVRIGVPIVPTDNEPYDLFQLTYTGKTATSLTGCVSSIAWNPGKVMATGDIVAVGSALSNFNIFIENIKITTSAGVQTVRATGKTATSFTGVIGGTGTMSTGGEVTRASDYPSTQQPGIGTITARIAAGSNGATLPQATIHVNDTSQFPSSGTMLVDYDWDTGTGTSVTYTGKTATTFTGCTGGSGQTMTTGDVVGGIGQDPRWPNEIWGSMPAYQWNNTPAEGTSIPILTSWNSGDFINDGRDIMVEDDQTTRPTGTGDWLESYVELPYPHSLNDFTGLPSGQKRTRVGGKDIRIGGKVIKIGDN